MYSVAPSLDAFASPARAPSRKRRLRGAWIDSSSPKQPPSKKCRLEEDDDLLILDDVTGKWQAIAPTDTVLPFNFRSQHTGLNPFLRDSPGDEPTERPHGSTVLGASEFWQPRSRQQRSISIASSDSGVSLPDKPRSSGPLLAPSGREFDGHALDSPPSIATLSRKERDGVASGEVKGFAKYLGLGFLYNSTTSHTADKGPLSQATKAPLNTRGADDEFAFGSDSVPLIYAKKSSRGVGAPKASKATASGFAQPNPRFDQALDYIQALSGHHFTDTNLLREALYLGMPTYIGERYIPEANKRLALIGDAALRLAWWDGWWYGYENRGSADPRFRSVSTNVALAAFGKEKGLDRFQYPFANTNTWMMATTVEAILGAVYVDSGRDITAVKRALSGFIDAPVS